MSIYAQDPNEEITTTQKLLTSLRYSHSVRVKGDDWRNMTAELDYAIDFDEYRIMLETMVHAEELAADTYTTMSSVEYPETTWQTFKDTNQHAWWLGWLVRRRPVRYKKVNVELEVEVKRYVKYPDAQIPVHRLGRPVPVEIMGYPKIRKTEE